MEVCVAITYLLVDVFDQLVQVLVPGVGVLVLEVTAHGHHDVVGVEVLGLYIQRVQKMRYNTLTLSQYQRGLRKIFKSGSDVDLGKTNHMTKCC